MIYYLRMKSLSHIIRPALRSISVAIAILLVCIPLYMQASVDDVSQGQAEDDARCIVNFDADGGSVSESTREKAAGSQIGTLPQPTWQGYIFHGWWTERDGKGEQVDETTIIESNVTFYAYWLMNCGYVHFVPNYDTGENTGIESSNGAYYGYFPWPSDDHWKSWTRPGYVFNGWWTQPVGGERMIEGMSVEGDLTVYAHWAIAEDMHFDAAFSNLDLVPGVKITVTPPEGENLDANLLAKEISIVPMDKTQETRFFKVVSKVKDNGDMEFEAVIDAEALELEKTVRRMVAVDTLAAFAHGIAGEKVKVFLANVKKGFYYGVAISGDIDGLSAAARNVVFKKADQDVIELELTKPQGRSAFFRVLVKERP